MSSLTDLALHSNQFRHIPQQALTSIGSSLRTLDLGENLINEVHGSALSGLTDLYGLRLAGNQIERLNEGTFRSANRIKMLNLADNRIQHIDQDTFRPLKKLKVSIGFQYLYLYRSIYIYIYISIQYFSNIAIIKV